MPIIIDYFQFATPTGSFPIAPLQPYQYSGISGGISSLEKNDPTIVFTNLPSGLRITNTGSTAPFDSVYMTFEGIDNYLMYSGLSGWTGSSAGYTLQCSYTSGGFWAIARETEDQSEEFIIVTGSGNITTPILNISFQQPNIEVVTYSVPTSNNIILKRGGEYTFSNGSGSFPNVYFHQETNDSWYPVNIFLDPGATSSLRIQGFSYNGNYSATVLTPGFGGYLEYSNGSHEYYDTVLYSPPEPFNGPYSSFAVGYPWINTVPNEVMSSYTILSDNSGNSGAASIRLNDAQQFSDLADPLRKLHVVFKRPNT